MSGNKLKTNKKSLDFCLLISLGLLLLIESLSRFTGIPGYDQPFVKDHHFGSLMYMVLMGKINDGGGRVAAGSTNSPILLETALQVHKPRIRSELQVTG